MSEYTNYFFVRDTDGDNEKIISTLKESNSDVLYMLGEQEGSEWLTVLTHDPFLVEFGPLFPCCGQLYAGEDQSKWTLTLCINGVSYSHSTISGEQFSPEALAAIAGAFSVSAEQLMVATKSTVWDVVDLLDIPVHDILDQDVERIPDGVAEVYSRGEEGEEAGEE